MQNYKICPHCGEVLRPGALTCTYCKQKVNKVNPFVDIFEVSKAEKTSVRNQNTKKNSGASPVKSAKKPFKANQTGKNGLAGRITQTDKTTQAGKMATTQKSDVRDSIQRTTADPDASWQSSQNHAWSENEKKAWEAKKNNKQTKGYGKQRTAAAKPSHSTGRYSGKNDTKSGKKKKWIIALVIIFIILSEIPWSSFEKSFNRFGFYLRQEAEHLQQMFGLEDFQNKSRGNSSNDTASGADTDGAFVLKPDSMDEDYDLSSVRIFAPDGYTLEWMDEDQSLLWINSDSYDLYGQIYLLPNTDDMRNSCRNGFDYLNDTDEYTNIEIKDEQQYITKAGTVSYVTAEYTYTDNEEESDYTECFCWMEYDDNTLLVLDLYCDERNADLSDAVPEIFTGVENHNGTI